MIRKPDELTEPIRRAVDHKAVLYSHVLLVLVIALQIVLDPTTSHLQAKVAILLCGSLLVLVLLRVFDMVNINNRPRLYLIIYQLLFFFGIAFASQPSTPFLLALFILVFIGNLYYGVKGVWVTVACFGITTIVKYIYLAETQHIGVSARLHIISAFFIFLAVCILFVNIQKVFDWDREQFNDTLKKEMIGQKRMLALINNMTESVLVLDKEGIITLYNAAALALFNTNASLKGKTIDALIKLENEKGELVKAVDLLPAGNKPQERRDLKAVYSEEDTAAISLVATPIRPTFGYTDIEAGYVVTLRDITREKSLEEERDEFISVISHELRTPVTVVEAGVSNSMMLAEKMKDSKKISDSLKTAHDEAIYLANMLNDLSTFARAEKGILSMEVEIIDPVELIEHLKQDYENQARAKGLELATQVDELAPKQLASNRLYIREILQNFITNAIKYSDKGTITVALKAQDNGVLFSVSDQGIGISVGDQKKVFNKFFRAEDYRTRSTNGTGLGLYITKKLAKILDASFRLESEVGKGSTFSVFIPDKSEALKDKKPEAKPVTS